MSNYIAAMQNIIHTAPLLTHKLEILFPGQIFLTCSLCTHREGGESLGIGLAFQQSDQ